jgi:hypothetical protein
MKIGSGDAATGRRSSGSISQRFRTDLRMNERAAAMEISNFKDMYLAELQELECRRATG